MHHSSPERVKGEPITRIAKHVSARVHVGTTGAIDRSTLIESSQIRGLYANGFGRSKVIRARTVEGCSTHGKWTSITVLVK